MCWLLFLLSINDNSLFNLYSTPNSVNVKLGEPQARTMTTGLHLVRDVCCVKCDQVVGWKYVSGSLHHWYWVQIEWD
jgi:hypothetical protein